MNKIICTTIMSPDILDVFNLPIPSAKNTGGYREMDYDNNHDSGHIIFSYSSIDLCVAGLTQYYLNGKMMNDNINSKLITINNLSEWFIHNPDRIGEMWVTCTTSVGGLIVMHNITEWRVICKIDSSLHLLFKKNAPFTFRSC